MNCISHKATVQIHQNMPTNSNVSQIKIWGDGFQKNSNNRAKFFHISLELISLDYGFLITDLNCVKNKQNHLVWPKYKKQNVIYLISLCWSIFWMSLPLTTSSVLAIISVNCHCLTGWKWKTSVLVVLWSLSGSDAYISKYSAYKPGIKAASFQEMPFLKW